MKSTATIQGFILTLSSVEGSVLACGFSAAAVDVLAAWLRLVVCPSFNGKVNCSNILTDKSDRLFDDSCLLLESFSPIKKKQNNVKMLFLYSKTKRNEKQTSTARETHLQ